MGGRTVGLDTGFIVHNDRTYPTLLRLFRELGVVTQESDMSMSVRDDEAGLEYAGARAARGLFPRAANLANGRYLRMLTEVRKFHREARAVLAREATDSDRDETLGSFAERCGFSAYFTRHFLEPVVAAVWSCDPGVSLHYPARYLFEFLDHHGMLTVFGSPTWRTVTGGSRRYVEALAAGIDDVRLSTPVRSVVETPDGVVVTDAHGVEEPVRLRGHRCAPAPGAGHAGAADQEPARRAQCDPVLEQRRPAAHRRVGAAAVGRSAGVVELLAPGRSGRHRGARHL